MNEPALSSLGIQEGDLVAGKYRLGRVLGEGGMGVVFAAHRVDLDDTVALKFLRAPALADAEAVARFSREARAAVKIKGEHVAKVFDVGRLPNGAPFIVMEYLDGSDLDASLRQTGPLPVEQAVELVLQACEAIAEAHALGIVHRDLKPSNLFLTRRPDGSLAVKVLDFGISKGSGLATAEASLTHTSAMLGSPLYMSPEQLRSSKDADARSDIWAIGVILYELIAGEPPFDGDTVPALVLRIGASEPTPLRSKRPGIPKGLEGVVFRCLAKDAAARYQTMAELASALLPYAPRRARTSVERISGILSGGKDGGAEDAARARSAERRVNARARWLVAGGAGVLLVVAAFVAVLARPFGARSVPSPTLASSTEPAVAPPPHADPAPAPEVTPEEPRRDAAVRAISSAGPRPVTQGPTASPVRHDVKSGASPKPERPDTPASVPVPPPSGSANCKQKFVLDAQGHKHFKPECFAAASP